MTPPTRLDQQLASMRQIREDLTIQALRLIVDVARDACSSTHTIRLESKGSEPLVAMALRCAHPADPCHALEALRSHIDDYAAHLSLDHIDDPAAHGLTRIHDHGWDLSIATHLVRRNWAGTPDTITDALPADLPPAEAHEHAVRISDSFTLPIIVDPDGQYILGADVAAILAHAGSLGYTQTWVNEAQVILHHEDTCTVALWQTNADGMWPARDIFTILDLPTAGE